MSFLRKMGKGALIAAKAAERVNDGMDEVFGENRTRPGEGFSMQSAGEKSRRTTEKMKQDGSDQFMNDAREQDFFGEKSKEGDDDSRFI